MESFFAVVGAISGFFWNYLFLVVLVGGGIYLTVRLKFFQIRHLPYIIRQTFGKILDKGKGEGTVSPFQAAATAMASTIGASNIVGVPAAIAFGGPGALFWMWVIFLVGGATKFTEVVLGVHFRQKNADGHYVGGPGYYMTKAFSHPVARAVAGTAARVSALVAMVYYFPSIATQSISLIQNAEGLGINKYAAGAVLMVLVGAVVLGGLIRVAKTADKMVPVMCVIYFLGSLVVVFANIGNLLPCLALVFKAAFTSTAATGGFIGAGMSMAIRMGLARATYSCEAGMGSAPIAHSSAITDHPVRQGFWGVFEVLIDGSVCTLSGLVVLTSGVWKEVTPDAAFTMPSIAFQKVLGPIGGYIVTISVFLFVLSSIIAVIWYGEKLVEFFFNTKISKYTRVIYTLSVMLGAFFGLEAILAVLDLTNALIILPNVVTILILSPLVAKLTREYFTGEQYYLKDTKKR
ncbi:MAG: sodium:alanine symporter family protein [Treponema sp.]|jgi:AGCS family alanine or glycine:cation symporter|nr:sodium:alanine symporter family protein [Treponema sp.]